MMKHRGSYHGSGSVGSVTLEQSLSARSLYAGLERSALPWHRRPPPPAYPNQFVWFANLNQFTAAVSPVGACRTCPPEP